MSSRPIRLLVEDIYESIDKIDRCVAGLERENFVPFATVFQGACLFS